ncbi:MAG: HEAT repeat domain-containing protein [Coriobacteriales bacterium]|nr:HEAT repeat domain-containing protein [Coriobacteriales bacterium]
MNKSNDISADDRAQALEFLLHDSEVVTRKSAVVALGRMQGSVARDMLCRALDDADEGVRVLACQALARLTDAGCLGAVLSHTHDESPQVKCGILWILANLIAHGNLSNKERSSLFEPIAIMAFDPHDAVRADAAAIIGTLHDARALDALVVLLEDDCTKVRAQACTSLGLIPSVKAVDLLLSILEDKAEKPLVYVSALDALVHQMQTQKLEDETCERALKVIEALISVEVVNAEEETEPSEVTTKDVQATAIWALGFVAPLSTCDYDHYKEILQQESDSPDSWKKKYAAEALTRLGT